jgi:hypothetical protein
MSMTPKQRLLTALQRGKPDRLPVTTHHLMLYFPDKYMGGNIQPGVLRALRPGRHHLACPAQTRSRKERLL